MQKMSEVHQLAQLQEGDFQTNHPARVEKCATSHQGVSRRGKLITGVRKIWGTKKCVSCNDVRYVTRKA